MNKSILDKVMNAGIPIIKPGTIVKLARTNEEVYIRTAFMYPDSSIVYTGYIFKPDNQRQEVNAIYPTEIKDYDKMLSVGIKAIEPNISSTNNLENNEMLDSTLSSLYSEVLSTRLAVYNNGTLYSNPGILDKFDNPEEAYRNLLIKFELRTASNYGYIEDKLILPNDSYIIVYFRNNLHEAFIPVDCITRKVVLKPFIKRMFNTLLYGRSHPSNFISIENNISYTNRLLELISNQQKEKGYIQYSRSEVTI